MELRRALAERVNRKVAGHGVSAAAVDAAVDLAVSALAARGVAVGTTPASTTAASGTAREQVAALSARSTPDLATRIRRALEQEGIVLDRVGLAASGAHTVVTLRVPGGGDAALRRVADQLGLALTFLPSDEGPVPA